MSGAGQLRETVCRAHATLAGAGLVMGTFGNVSAVDRDAGVMLIKPSGVPYESLTPDMMVAVALDTGAVVGGDLKPSSDTPTHLELYRAFACGAVVHTHSEFATMFAQAQMPIRCMGTTHADSFRGDVPVTRALSAVEVDHEYERSTGRVIVETFTRAGVSPSDVPGVLVAHHGPFTWGRDPDEAIDRARVLEFVARLEWRRLQVAPEARAPDSFLIDRHFFRKHGPDATYGQS
jgi:L-ribulose-5-phosphate 4-epimerase